MDYDKILNDTLLAIKSMPTEKFEEICIRHGYTPTRKESPTYTKENVSPHNFNPVKPLFKNKVSDSLSSELREDVTYNAYLIDSINNKLK